MYYIKFLLLTLFLTSCATTNETKTVSVAKESGVSPLEQSGSEKAEYKKALSLLNKGKTDAAKEIFQQFSDERPELAGPHANLAIIALKNNEPEKALELVKISLSKNPKFPQALNLIAYLEQVSGDIKSAEKHFKEAIANKENYAVAHYNIALLYDIYLQDIDSAIPHYERYMKLINNEDKKTADWLEQIKRRQTNG